MRDRSKSDFGRVIVVALVMAFFIITPIQFMVLTDDDSEVSYLQYKLDKISSRVRRSGKFDVMDYEELLEACADTGDMFDIDMELVENLTLMSYVGSTGEGISYNTYTEDIIDELYNGAGEVKVVHGATLFIRVNLQKQLTVSMLKGIMSFAEDDGKRMVYSAVTN